MSMWNPWRGCKKCSDGCLHCYIHSGESDTNARVLDYDWILDIRKHCNSGLLR